MDLNNKGASPSNIQLSGIQKEVLHTLVDRFENRKHYGSGAAGRRRTALKVDAKRFPDYFHPSDSSFRLLFNAEMEQLQRRGLVSLDWVRFDRGHTLAAVVLEEAALQEIYASLGRRSKEQLYREAAALLAARRETAPPELQPLYRTLLERLAAYDSLPAPLKADRPGELADYLAALHAFFEHRDAEVARRALSVQLYGDSKRWEQLEKGILQLLRGYCLPAEEAEAEDDAILAERGIVDNPGHIRLAGPLVVSTPRGKVDLALFYPDLGLPAEMARDLAVESCAAAAVVTVENLTAYYQYIRQGPPEHLKIYLGGYHNRARRELLCKLHRYLEHGRRAIPFYHWGDIDLGGFQIWRDLCRRTGIPFKPLLMDERTYLEHLHRGQPFPESYGEKLAALLQDPAYGVFHALIALMLQKRIRVEQEAVSLARGGRQGGICPRAPAGGP